jgi:hypothetical protein
MAWLLLESLCTGKLFADAYLRTAEADCFYSLPTRLEARAKSFEKDFSMRLTLSEVEKEEEKDTSLAGTTSINLPELNQRRTFIRPIQVVNIGRRRDFHPVFLDMGLLAV